MNTQNYLSEEDGTFTHLFDKPVIMTEKDYKIYFDKKNNRLIRLSREESINHKGVCLAIHLDTTKRVATNPNNLVFVCLDSERDEHQEYFV